MTGWLELEEKGEIMGMKAALLTENMSDYVHAYVNACRGIVAH